MLVALTRGMAVVFEWPLAGVYAGVGIALGLIGLAVLTVAWRLLHTLRLLPKTRETLRQPADQASRSLHEAAGS